MAFSPERGSPQLSKQEQVLIELKRMEDAFDEAKERLEAASDDDEVFEVWASDTSDDPQNLQRFLDQNEQRLSEEAKFFLAAAIHLRKKGLEYRKLSDQK